MTFHSKGQMEWKTSYRDILFITTNITLMVVLEEKFRDHQNLYAQYVKTTLRECRKHKREGVRYSLLLNYRLYSSISCVKLLYRSPKSK